MSVTDGVTYPERAEGRMTMESMPTAPAHAKPASRDRLLWIVAVIAAFALYDVWGAWTEVGDKSGFAHGTGWTLTVIVEAFGICALVAWLADAPGPRSRRFAMWSAVIVFALSLAGQASSHLTARSQVPPAVVVVLVSVLPVIVLALGAVLIHLRIKDRAEAEEAVRVAAARAERIAAEAAEADERTALRAELEAQREALTAAETERSDAQREAAEAAAKADSAARKLAAISARKQPAKKPAISPRSKGASSRATEVPNDVDAQAEALAILAAEPDIKGAKLGPRVGKSERWGQLFLKGLATAPTARPDGGES